jgi:hypothetical protein
MKLLDATFFNDLKKAHLKGRRKNLEGAVVYKPKIFLHLMNTGCSATGYIFEALIWEVDSDNVRFLCHLYEKLPPVVVPYERVVGMNIRWQKEVFETRRVPRQINSEKFKIRNHEIREITFEVDASELEIKLPISTKKTKQV